MVKSAWHRLVLAGVGVLLILVGLRGVVLQVVGKATQAAVTDVKKDVSQQSDAMDHNYRISYRFSVNGKDYRGTLTRKKVYNAVMLPSVGASVPIRYLASAPMINAGTNEGAFGGLVLGGLGVGLFVIGIKPRKSVPQGIPAADARTDATS
jgi:hypothetical protein